jgi:sporulation protein YlmC with PRC-barrel domain
MSTIHKDRILQFRGENLCDRDGDKLGSIEEIYLDAETNEPEWALIHTGLFGTKRTFVPIRDASEADGSLTVPFEKSAVKDAPQIEANGQLSQQEEAELYRYYGMEYSEARSDTGLPEGGGASLHGSRDLDADGTAGRGDRDFDAEGAGRGDRSSR